MKTGSVFAAKQRRKNHRENEKTGQKDLDCPMEADKIMVDVILSLHDCHCLCDVLVGMTAIGLSASIPEAHSAHFVQLGRSIQDKFAKAVNELDISDERKERALRYALGGHV